VLNWAEKICEKGASEEKKRKEGGIVEAWIQRE
jgi:hypothetical protein